MHLTESILRAFLDHELSEQEQTSTSDHLRKCAECSDQLASLQKNSEAVRNLFSAVAPDNIPNPEAAFRRFEAQKVSMPRGFLERLISARMRPAFAALGAVALVVVALNLKPVRVWAARIFKHVPYSANCRCSDRSHKSEAVAGRSVQFRNEHANGKDDF